LEEKIRADGGEWSAGMAVRILNIDVTGVNRNVDPATLRNINQIDQHFGHAGPAFVTALIDHGLHRQGQDLRERVLKAARVLAGGDSADGATARAALALAVLMVVGELAKTFSLIPQDTRVQDAVTWAWAKFLRSSDAVALDPETQAIEARHRWIAERWDVTIKQAGTGGGSNRETIAWYDVTSVYIPKQRLREAAGNGMPESEVASILHRRGLLARRTGSDRLYVRWIPGEGKIKAYALSRTEFGRSNCTSDPDAYEV
jgi:hypothetical protein